MRECVGEGVGKDEGEGVDKGMGVVKGGRR